ncbi:hypothetical protein MSG28_002642 [Choristoneura fumiferana]|uniref:Uncharacterized protein n=1 Tax=Choristoneura fumiferana TaxID=7141 RepID=A0ACC0JIP3_CHOFU|nr:hypothetical protein MSG28_002642 [Choristoneura fumiferana]
MRNYFKRFVECYSQTVGERTEVDKMMSITFIIQSAFWHNVLDPQWTWKRYYIHQLLNLALVVYVFFGTMEIITSATDFQIIAEAYYTIILIGTCPVKLLIFINNRFAFRKLYIITKTTFYDFIRNDSEERLAEVIKTGTKVSKYFESDVQVAGTCTVMQCSAMRAKVQLPGIYCIADNRIKATYSRGISGFHRIINLKVKLQSRLTIAIKTTHVLCGTVGGRGAMLLIQLSQYSTGPRAINCG